MEGAFVDVTYSRMEETRPHVAIGLDDGGHPGRVAKWRHGLRLPQLGAEMPHNAPQFFRILRHEAGFDGFVIFLQQGFDLAVEFLDFLGI